MEDRPPTYSEAIAEIEEERRRRPTVDSQTWSESHPSVSLRGPLPPNNVDTEPDEPPPPYSEHCLPSAPPQSPDDGDARNHGDEGIHNVDCNQGVSHDHIPSDHDNEFRHHATSRTSLGTGLQKSVGEDEKGGEINSNISELGATGNSNVRSDKQKWDVNLPGPIFFHEKDFTITKDSPPFIEIKWYIPENASDFSHLIYVVEYNLTPIASMPLMYQYFANAWLKLLETATPSFRIFQSRGRLMIENLRQYHRNNTIFLRVRAVDGLNQSRSCKKGPWSEDITINFADGTNSQGPARLPQVQDHHRPSAPPLPSDINYHGDDVNSEKDSELNLALPSASKLDSDDSELGATGCSKPTKEQEKFDLNLPGPICWRENDITLADFSPPCTEVKWSVPENAGDFSHLIYVAEFRTTVKPDLTSICSVEWWPRFDPNMWYRLLESATPSFRIFRSNWWQIMIGPLKWRMNKSTRNRINIRIRAVDELNRLPSCKKGPWSEELRVHYTCM